MRPTTPGPGAERPIPRRYRSLPDRIATAAATGATPDRLHRMATRTLTPPRKGRKATAADLSAAILRQLRALDRRLAGSDDYDPEPEGVGLALTAVKAALREREDDVARALRATERYSMTQIAAILGVSVATAERRWTRFPGGLPEGGRRAGDR